MARVKNGELDVRALAKVFGITDDPARNPGRFVSALKTAMQEAIQQIDGTTPPEVDGDGADEIEVEPGIPVAMSANRRPRFVENGDPAWGETNDPLPMPGDMLR